MRPATPEQYLPSLAEHEETKGIEDSTSSPSEPPPPARPSTHPIEELIQLAEANFEQLMRGSDSPGLLRDAAAIYREKRGRHPPPGFDKWFEYAKGKNALALENLFDQIYVDLEPFWSLDQTTMLRQSRDWPFLFSIRNGEVKTRNARPVAGEWLDYWGDMFKELGEALPDVDIPINHIDESRVIVPWEDMNAHMEAAAKTRNADKPATKDDVVTTYPSRAELSFEDIPLTGLTEDGPVLNNETMWELTRLACPPESPARQQNPDRDMSVSPKFPSTFPPGSLDGYVSNWTHSKNVCEHPDLRNVFGTFVNPRFTSVNTTLFPLFGGCKIAGVNNDILLPAAKYLSSEEEFAFNGTDISWSEKKDGLVWRGQATGGAHNDENWKRFHRHRFVAMLNGSFVSTEEQSPILTAESIRQPNQASEIKGAFAGIGPAGPEAADPKTAQPHHIPLPSHPQNPYNLSALKTTPQTTLGEYLTPKTNIGFDHFMCAPWVWSILGDGKECGYMNHFYTALDRMTMEEMFKYKYVPDVDGNSYSGRYRAYLSSGSLPIKATIWSEWHDSRLVAWKHFVPVDNTYVDLWGVLEYFWGYGTGADEQFGEGGFREGESRDAALVKPGHDAQAERIATEGKEWAEKVLRREDMLVYVYRLVLEYARIVSDERERMAYVEDLF